MRKVLIVIFMFWLAGTTQAQNLKINEFMASNDSALADSHGEYDDWIEIYNPGPDPVNIGGLYITDDLAKPTAWQIPDTAPDSTTIPPGGFLLLWADKQPEQGVRHVKLKLSSKGEQIGLFAADGKTPIDTLTFSKQETDVSMGRYPDGANTWMNFQNSTPRYTNRPIPIVINEFMASNDACCADAQGDFDDWLELFNAGTAPVDVGGMFLTDDLKDPAQWQIPSTAPDSTTIPPGGHLVFWADKEPEEGVFHAPFKLSGKGEQIGLFAADTSVVDTLSFGPQAPDTSYGRVSDGIDTWTFFSTPTPGAANALGVPTVVHEEAKLQPADFVLLQNFPNPFNPSTHIVYTLPQSDFVELAVYNAQGERVVTLIRGNQLAGRHQIVWSGKDSRGRPVGTGLYFYRLKTKECTASGKMLFLK